MNSEVEWIPVAGMGEMPRSPAFRGHGAKWLLRHWLHSFLAVPHECFVEPFCQTASITLTKPRSDIEVINDKNGDIVNYFKVLREQSGALIQAIALTPWAYEEYLQCWEPTEEPLERARRFYVRSHLTMRMATSQQTNLGFRRQKRLTKEGSRKRMTHAPRTFMKTDHLWQIAQRLRGVQIECMGATAVIQLYDAPTTLIYCDPPYPHHLRKRTDDYARGCEMSDSEHEALLRVLLEVKGLTAISSYRQANGQHNELYLDMLTGWPMHSKVTQTQKGKREECLWLNPALADALAEVQAKQREQVKASYPLFQLIKEKGG